MMQEALFEMPEAAGAPLPRAISEMHLTDEETVRRAVAAVQSQPITIWLGTSRLPRPAVDYDEGAV